MDTVAGGTVHAMPADLRKAILTKPKVKALWNDITPLARNEWICWVISGKKAETRQLRINKALSKMSGGMRRPCCWVGCVHRADKPLSSAQNFVLSKQKKYKLVIAPGTFSRGSGRLFRTRRG